MLHLENLILIVYNFLSTSLGFQTWNVASEFCTLPPRSMIGCLPVLYERRLVILFCFMGPAETGLGITRPYHRRGLKRNEEFSMGCYGGTLVFSYFIDIWFRRATVNNFKRCNFGSSSSSIYCIRCGCQLRDPVIMLLVNQGTKSKKKGACYSFDESVGLRIFRGGKNMFNVPPRYPFGKKTLKLRPTLGH